MRNVLNTSGHQPASEDGFTIVEIFVILAVISFAAVLLGSYTSSARRALHDARKSISIDLMESQISGLSAKLRVIENSLEHASKKGLLSADQEQCFIRKKFCRNANVSATIPLVGSTGDKPRAITGLKAPYNEYGEPCTGPCKGLVVVTHIVAMCDHRPTCSGPDFYVVKNVYGPPPVAAKTGSKRRLPIRVRTQEVRPGQEAPALAGVTLACPSPLMVLTGVRATGEAICTPFARLVFEDAEVGETIGPVRVRPTDCRSSNGFVSEIKWPSGEVICTPKFWGKVSTPTRR